jgi:hypothetical protein
MQITLLSRLAGVRNVDAMAFSRLNAIDPTLHLRRSEKKFGSDLQPLQLTPPCVMRDYFSTNCYHRTTNGYPTTTSRLKQNVAKQNRLVKAGNERPQACAVCPALLVLKTWPPFVHSHPPASQQAKQAQQPTSQPPSSPPYSQTFCPILVLCVV